MAHHHWPFDHGWFELGFGYLGNSSESSRKQILGYFKEIFCYDENVFCVYSFELAHRGGSNEYSKHNIILQQIEKTFLN